MWVLVKEMFTQYYLENNLGIYSNRNYLCDYSIHNNADIDMSLSGTMVSKYHYKLKSDIKVDKYPSEIVKRELISLIKNHIKANCEVVLGAGGNGILQNIVKVLFAKKKGSLVTPFFSFDQAEFAVTSYGGKTKRVFTNDYKIDLDTMLKCIDEKTKMVYLCNPNNPTGDYIDSQRIISFVNNAKAMVVVDESGIEFTQCPSILDLLNDFPDNLIVIRSFSKAYGLAGMRIGYMACSNRFKREYMKNVTINECSVYSYMFAINALENKEKILNDNIRHIIRERKKLEDCLCANRVKFVKSSSNVIMTSTIFDKKILNRFCKEGIVAVPIYDKNKQLHLRLAVQDARTNKIFCEAFSRLMGEEKMIKGIDRDKGGKS